MESIKTRLSNLFPEGEWNINESGVGESKQAFIASNGERKAFVKFDVKSPALIRLSGLAVAPKVVYDGTKEVRPYVIQEFVEGKYPDISWYANNLELLAQFIRKYQQDGILKNILSKETNQSYREHIEMLADLSGDIGNTQSDIFESESVKKGLQKLKEQSEKLVKVSLVPTHSDPNPKNFLLTDKGLTMVDWDDIVLSDPMKDVSLMLWWYIPRAKWSTFFKFYGQELDEEKIYWFIARSTMSIAGWFDKRGDKENAKFFVNDFLLALEMKDNSQIFFNNQS